MGELQEKDIVSYYINTLVEIYGDKIAIRWKSSYRIQSFSYLDLYNNARRVVSLLHSMDIKKGDKVCIWTYNSPGWVIFLFGCLMSGIIVVPIDFNSLAEFTNTVIRKVKAKAILLSRFKNLDNPSPKLYVEDLLEKLKDIEPIPLSNLPEIKANDLVEIVFTSGTTSAPKGVLITNRNLVSNIRSVRYMMPFDPTYKFLSILPFSHLLEQVLGLFYPLRFGATILYTRTRKSSEIIKLSRKHKITTMVCVPFFLESLKNNILSTARRKGNYPLSKLLMMISARLPFRVRRILSYFVRRTIGRNLRFFISGGSKLNRATEDFWMTLGIKVFQGYGLTEASPVATCNVRGQHKAYTVGRSLPEQEVRIADDGEILIRGRNVTPGYYQDEEATKAAFEEGWYKTGDIGELDRGGYLIIKGRKKDMILTTAGLNIFPRDIEVVLNELPFVKESCVVGLEDDGKTKIYATVIPESSCADTIEQIIKKANEKLNPNQKIQAGSFWSDKEFPKTPTLKIKKYEVIKTLKKHKRLLKKKNLRIKVAEGIESNLLELLANFLQISSQEIRNNSQLVDDLGLDSLGLVELVVMLEEWFNIDFDESNLRPTTTIADLQNLIESSAKIIVRLPEVSWARTPLIILMRDILQKLCNIYLRGIVDLEIRGQEILPDLPLPAIFVANHTSHLDTPTILYSLPPNMRRRVTVAAAADYFFGINVDTNEQMGWARKMLPVIAPLIINAFPFCRKESIRKSLGLLGELLDESWSVVIYPEGTRSLTGEMSSFKPGIGLIATEMLVPIVPVKLEGLYEILPKGRIIPRKGKAKVTFGKPIFFNGEHDYSLVAKRIENTLRIL